MNLLGTLGVKICQAWEWAQIPGVVSTVVTSTPPMCVIRTPGVLWVEGGCCKAYRSGVYVCVCVCTCTCVSYRSGVVYTLVCVKCTFYAQFENNDIFKECSFHTHTFTSKGLVNHSCICMYSLPHYVLCRVCPQSLLKEVGSRRRSEPLSLR